MLLFPHRTLPKALQFHWLRYFKATQGLALIGAIRHFASVSHQRGSCIPMYALVRDVHAHVGPLTMYCPAVECVHAADETTHTHHIPITLASQLILNEYELN